MSWNVTKKIQKLSLEKVHSIKKKKLALWQKRITIRCVVIESKRKFEKTMDERKILLQHVVWMGEDNTPNKKRDKKEEVKLLERIRTKKPKMFRVLIHNDDYTTQEFVVYILNRFFQKDATESFRIMLEAHTKGNATVGVYTKDVAESKVQLAENYSKENGHPLMLSIELE